MDVTIAVIDALAACMFFAAAVLAWLTHNLAAQRTPIWAYTALAFLLFALDRGSNMLEWGMSEQFAWMDALQGYVAALACLALVGLALQFRHFIRRLSAPREV